MVKSRVLWAVGTAAIVGCVAVVVSTQTAPIPATFEVASIKPDKSGSGNSQWGTERGGRFSATNVTTEQLVLDAYQLQSYQLLNAPRWFTVDRFDIVAKANGEIPDAFDDERRVGPTPIQLILRSFLAERFNLATHNEKRELPAYSLIIARSDGQLGPGLVKSAQDCASADRPGPARTGAPPCSMRWGAGRLSANTMLLSTLAGALAQLMDRPVFDRTGVKDAFDITLAWSPDQVPRQLAPDSAPLGDGPSIFTAIQEQLGLKLESTRGPVDVLVIDRVERPSED